MDGSWDLRVADFNLSIRAEEAEESPRCKEMLSIHPRWLVRIHSSMGNEMHSEDLVLAAKRAFVHPR